MAADPLGTDPQAGARWPTATPALAISSGGVALPAVLHLPAGPGRTRWWCCCTASPGTSAIFDLAQVLRRAGYAALVFHYRGSWGTGRTWSWTRVLEDCAAVTRAIRGPAIPRAHRLEARRLAVAGHSLGGFAALMTAAADPSITAVVSVAGSDFAAAAAACHASPARRGACAGEFGSDLLPLRGTSGEALAAEREQAGPPWSLAALAPPARSQPVLLIGTSRDTITPATGHLQPVADAHLAQPINHEHHVFATGHALSDHRVALARTMVRFRGTHRRGQQ
jgi:pimeloyl-ACP methyl ester carboxylesterase